MKKNMGLVDRVVRLLLVILIFLSIGANRITGAVAVIMGILALLFIITSLLGFCPIYVPFKISTLKKK